MQNVENLTHLRVNFGDFLMESHQKQEINQLILIQNACFSPHFIEIIQANLIFRFR